jgi:hypothetical protein
LWSTPQTWSENDDEKLPGYFIANNEKAGGDSSAGFAVKIESLRLVDLILHAVAPAFHTMVSAWWSDRSSTAEVMVESLVKIRAEFL